MGAYLKQSRISKALTDSSDMDFDEAQQHLSATRVVIVTSSADISTPAGQACILTAVNAVKRTFGAVVLVSRIDAQLCRPIPGAIMLLDAARILGAQVLTSLPEVASHFIIVGRPGEIKEGFAVRCWWDGWRAGVRSACLTSEQGASWNPLSGVFAGALAVRDVFANVRGQRTSVRSSTISLWEPWVDCNKTAEDPSVVYLPQALTLIGLGHLGQGFLWSLSMLPGAGHLVLQDDQHTGVENEPTGLVTRLSDVGNRKTRVASRWMEYFGWKTALIERRFSINTKACETDPQVVVTALDSPVPRRHVLESGFSYMIDAGVGHGPVDFESVQLRCFARGDAPSWDHPAKAKDNDAVLQRRAYRKLSEADGCGAFDLAAASVAVPYVGAAVGALSVAQILRLGAMESTSRLLQLELAAPDMPSAGRMVKPPSANLGTLAIDLVARTHMY